VSNWFTGSDGKVKVTASPVNECSLKRKEAIEPVIGHLKTDGLLD
jgi:hypothetical protein